MKGKYIKLSYESYINKQRKKESVQRNGDDNIELEVLN